MTGAYSALKLNAPPTFMILEFKSTEITIYEYSLADGELNCQDTRIKKPWFNTKNTPKKTTLMCINFI